MLNTGKFASLSHIFLNMYKTISTKLIVLSKKVQLIR